MFVPSVRHIVMDIPYYDAFAESIARQLLGKYVPAHAPRNNTVEMLSLCPRAVTSPNSG
jgi:hypothetical protein